MGKVSVAAFSRYMGIASGMALWLGGIVGMFYALQAFGIYGLVAGVLIHAFEYPIPGVKFLGPINDVLWIRGIVYILAAGPAVVIVPTAAGGFFIFITGWGYIWASARGEKWVDPFTPQREEGGGGGGGGGRKKEGDGGEKKKAAAPMNQMEMQAPYKPAYNPNPNRFDGYGPSDPGASSTTVNMNLPYEKPTAYAPSVKSSSSRPPYEPSGYDNSGYVKPSGRANAPAPPPPQGGGYDPSGYDPSGYDNGPRYR